ncbi:Pre-mRNA-splicing factor RSE1 [Fusarium oxysporum f. sp. albedinis]|nr:Pre-mRNA-splicing factor RSE1 [Fusarium oxysporum f. sp. albedinis]
MHWGSTDSPEEKDMNAMIPQIEGSRLNTEIYNMFLHFPKCTVQDGIQGQRQHNRVGTLILSGRLDLFWAEALTPKDCRWGETLVRLSVGASWAHMDTRVEGLVGQVGDSPRLP